LHDVGPGGGTTGAPGLRLAARAVLLGGRHKALGAQARLSLGLAFGVGGDGAGFVYALASGGHLRGVPRPLRLLVVVPQLHQQLALLDAVALPDRQHLDAATGDRRQLGALAGFDGPGAGVGDRRFDQAAFDFPEHHRHRLWPRCPPHASADQHDDGHSKQQTANQRRHGDMAGRLRVGEAA
jgi:hypothetical protein